MGRLGRPTKAVAAYNKSLFEQGSIKCHVCNEIKPLDEFGPNARRWHGKKTICNPCASIKLRQRVNIRRVGFNVIKESLGCMRCGYNEDGSKLHLHHRDPSTKLFNISESLTVSPKRLQEEIDKCDLLCDACHCIVEPRNPKGRKSKSTLDK